MLEDEEDVDKQELERAQELSKPKKSCRRVFFPLLVEMIASGGTCGGT